CALNRFCLWVLRVGFSALHVFFSSALQGFLASSRPSCRHLRALRRVIVLAGLANAFIERHRDVAAERDLNFHRDLRCNERTRSIEMISKFDAVLSELAQF